MINNENIQDENDWEAWDPDELSERLQQVVRPWCVVGGWALDIWHGQKTREHEDIEFTVMREDFSEFRAALSGIVFYVVDDGTLKLLHEGIQPDESVNQIWCYEPVSGRWKADMMIESAGEQNWIYKRDPAISRPRSEMVLLTEKGIPYLNPSAVLLFKAKYCRPKDLLDFSRAEPKLSASEKHWLKGCLMKLHPGHAWAETL